MMPDRDYDEVGPWSEVKLDIIEKYAAPYSLIVSKRFKAIYVDAFAGWGKHISKTSGDEILGSPLRALNVSPPFSEYFFIDIKRQKVNELKLEGDKSGKKVHVFEGDCNSILLEKVFPNIKYEDYRRGLCLLDPYGLHLDWEVMKKAGEMKSMEIFLNFPIMDTPVQ